MSRAASLPTEFSIEEEPKEGNKMFNILAGTEAEGTKIPSLPSEVPNVVGGADTSINN